MKLRYSITIKDPRAAVLAASALLAVVAALDFQTGAEVSFSIFYLLPVSLLAWNVGAAAGAGMSAACALSFFLWNYFVGSEIYLTNYAPYLNTLTEFSFFLITSFLISRQRELFKRLKQDADLKTEMVSMVSHEFNNAMSTIGVAAALLEEGDTQDLSGTRGKFYGMLKRTAGQLTLLTKTFLNKARLESGRFTLRLRPTELRKVAGEALKSLEWLGEEKGVFIATDFPREVIPLSADADALALVVSNLLGNALKYTPRGGRVTLRIRLAGAGRAVFSVEDTGIGISPEDLNKIFSGFYRTDEGKTMAKGFGVGLKVARELVEAHGTALEIESEPGKGSSFCFSLPIAAPEQPDN